MKFCLLYFLLAVTQLFSQEKFTDVMKEINDGNFLKAEKMIGEKLSDSALTSDEKFALEFQLERMERIRKDFHKSEEDVLKYIKKYYPEADTKMLAKWEEDGSLEFKIIDGEKKYFNRSGHNLFRINKDAKAVKVEKDGFKKDGLDAFLEEYLPGVVKESMENDARYVKPVKYRLNYTLTVDADVVPENEMLRVWMPFPKETSKRQESVRLVKTSLDEYVLASDKHAQRTIYMEKPAVKGEATEFSFSVEYTAYNDFTKVNPGKVKPYDKASDLYKHCTAERYPHIMFTDRVKELSEKIVGDEKNPYLVAKKIFTWISNTIPWAGAREYSTIDNISDYCIRRGHGDCGIKALTFITLCRYNGIPAKWQSGWMLHPGHVNLHDWAEFYLEGYGWLPVDQSFGITESDNEDVKYYFLGGMDAFRLIANEDFSQPLYPSKIYPRSETVDFQRGEVEWKGGNLYFDKWDYHMDVEYLNMEVK